MKLFAIQKLNILHMYQRIFFNDVFLCLYIYIFTAWCSVMTQKGEVGGGRFEREGIYVYIELIQFIVLQNLTNSVRQLYSSKKNF